MGQDPGPQRHTTVQIGISHLILGDFDGIIYLTAVVGLRLNPSGELGTSWHMWCCINADVAEQWLRYWERSSDTAGWWMWEMMVWAAEAESRAVSMPSGRQRKQFHTRAAKTPLFQALEEIFHDSLFPCCSSVLTNILWVASYFVASDISLEHLAKIYRGKDQR